MSIKARRSARAHPSSDAILGSLFDDASGGLALLDRAGHVLRANAPFAGFAPVGAGGLAWSAWPPELQVKLRAASRESRPLWLRAELPANSGRRRAADLSLLPVAGGGALIRITDRSHEQDVEEKLAQAQRLQAVGQLAGGIAHDFNNLLTAILGSTDALLSRAASPADKEDLEQVRGSACRGADLVRQLLAFGRQQTLQPRVLAVNTVIDALAKFLRPLLGSGVSVVLNLEEPSRRVLIDPTQLDQVLVNLAVNAGNAMPGGGTLTITTGHRLLLSPEMSLGEPIPPGRYACIALADTGVGIPQDVLPRILEPFFTTRRESGGTGLGLSTVHGIVRQSGGFLSVETAPGLGTVFRILLPRHEAAPWNVAPAPSPMPAPPPAPVIGPAQERSARTILLVEDEAPIRKLAERALAARGWTILTAACGQDALDDIAAAPGAEPALHCVVSDVVMPGMDGPSLVASLRKTFPALPAILVSGYADAALRTRLAGDDIVFLAKPFAMRDLADAVEGLLSAPTSPP